MQRLAVCLVLSAALAGCASVPMSDPAADAAAKTFRAPTDKAGLYIYRNESLGFGLKLRVMLDGQILGETAAKTFFYRELPPGKHVLSSMADSEDKLEIDLQSGTLTYVWQEVKVGMFAGGAKFQVVSEEQGRQGVMESSLIKGW